jgi:8-oxo-dGTP pyrophosphatase MutT (NUDIX family)
MYKVFFNDSSILIHSDSKKIINSNIRITAFGDGYDVVNQIIYKIERAESPLHFLIDHQDEKLVLKQFKESFTEIHAAGGFVRNNEGSILFIKRFGLWDLPKGKIENKETPELAAIREVEEECGLSGLKIIQPLDSTYHIYRSPWINSENNLVFKETKWFLMSYSGNESLVPQLDEDIIDAIWFPPSELEWLKKNTYSSLTDLIEKTLPVI